MRWLVKLFHGVIQTNRTEPPIDWSKIGFTVTTSKGNASLPLRPTRPYFPCLTASAGFVTPSSPVSTKIVSSAFCGPK